MKTAEFIESNIFGWDRATRIVINKKTIIGAPDIYVGIKIDHCASYLIELHAYDELVCFKSVRVVGDNVIFGFGSFVHFFNLVTEKVNSVELDTYFGDLYISQDLGYQGIEFGVLVASAEYLHRFTDSGEEIWKSPPVGIDGVTVAAIEYPIIRVSGEWDPPGGWVDMQIHMESGAKII